MPANICGSRASAVPLYRLDIIAEWVSIGPGKPPFDYFVGDRQ
jgi:hypothetical protein